MSTILKILTVAGLATFEMYAAIPAGFVFKLSPWVIFLASLSGGIIGVFVAAFLGEKIKLFIAKYKKPSEKIVKTDTLAHRIWNKYGIIGLGAIGTFFVGAPVCIAVGVGLNANLQRLVLWCCAGVLSRSIIFTLLGHYGLKLF
jgi:membrane protein YqaA with SNARE-associated domain